MFGSNTFGNLGARKGSKKRRRKARSASCRAGVVRFKTKRGKVVAFRGKTGPGCAPRKKPSTRHLARYKRALAAAARACKGKSAGAFRKCVAARM
jgi:hypothetical protein